MADLHTVRLGFRALFRRQRVDQELNEELQGFLEASVEAKMRQGLTEKEALRQARIEIGSVETVKHKIRGIGWETLLENLLHDLRYSFRMLAKSPGFSMVAILSLALGIGANAAIFSLINQLMLQSLPVNEPEKLVSLGKSTSGGQVKGLPPGPIDIYAYDFYKRVQKQDSMFDSLAAYDGTPFPVSIRTNVNGVGQAKQASSRLVSGNFFSVLRAESLMGRTLLPSDESAPGKDPVIVLSYRYWQQELAADPNIIGRTVSLNGVLYTVVGVMPKSFYGVDLNDETPDLWAPLTMQHEIMMHPSLLGPHDMFWLHILARQKSSTNLKQAQSWLTTQLQQYLLEEEGQEITPERRQEISQNYIPLYPASGGISVLRERYKEKLYVLMGAVALVLLIACANLANFLLAKAAQREKEISTRLALGSGRWRLARQLFLEAVALSLLGGSSGLLLSYPLTGALVKHIVRGSTRSALTASPDLRVLCFTFALALFTGLLFGLAPAIKVARMKMSPAWRSNTRGVVGSPGDPGRSLPKILVVAQVSLSLILLTGASIFLHSLQNLETQDMGFEQRQLLILSINPKFAGYNADSAKALYERIIDRLDVLPGVRSATVAAKPVFSNSSWNSTFDIPGYTPAPGEDISSSFNRVTRDYFKTARIPILSGRPILATDTANSSHVVVVNENLAKQYFPKGNAVGRYIKVDMLGASYNWQIVGVSKNSKYHGPRDEPERMVYVPISQLTGDSSFAYTIMLQSEGDPNSIVASIRAALALVDPNLMILDTHTIKDQIDRSIANDAMIAKLSTIFSLLALLLACIGLYGVMMHSVIRRTNEIGIRLALGAATSRVLQMILKESALLLGTGVLLGIPITLVLCRFIKSQLYGISPFDPLAIATAVCAISVVTMLAAYLPARRAAQVDPMVALRYE